MIPTLNWPLMRNNISRGDLDAVIEFLRQDDPILTHAHQVREFEREWAQWLGVKHCVMVNSGSSANLITLAALREKWGPGEIIVPPLTWVSDVAAVLQSGFTPVFADINPRTLGMDDAQVLSKITSQTRAVFLTHILGYNALTRRLLDGLDERKVPLIEDVCESHGATFEGKRLGSFSLMSNFSFYYAHHLSTIEGGMICTDDAEFYEMCRMFRSHGMVREASNPEVKQRYYGEFPDLNPDFIFAFPAYNMRSTEINAVLGRSQLKRLDGNNELRRRNLKLFLENLDSDKYRTDFATVGSCNYAFTLVLREPDTVLRDNIEKTLRQAKVEFRRGTSGGGNQMRQPYLKKMINREELKNYPNVEHVHFFGYYIGNYPDLEPERILQLCKLINATIGHVP
ncbi:MAG TPA: DegT/DnrJ/EryC1/StrS family aminotransferase [Phycisphaerae bacterium]|nr:DegT/DnrJ/EryC1/StrS family aminotransferase [Phycisphaerae bacterium]